MTRKKFDRSHAWHNRNGLAGCSKRLSSKAAASEGPEAYPLGYVENLNDARTLLAGFFSFLLRSGFWAVGIGRGLRGESFA